MGCYFCLALFMLNFCHISGQVKELNNILLSQIVGSPSDPEGDEIGFLSPDDFVSGSLIEATDVGEAGVDPIAESGKFEGDIDLRGLPYEAYVDKVFNDSPYQTEKEVGASAIRNKWFHWPGAEIQYEITLSNFTQQDRGVIASAIADYDKYTCIRWIPRQAHHKDYVRFISGNGCYSAIGKSGGRQIISLGSGCVAKGIVIHEMMHAAGFFHEQARADRNDFVTIVWHNIRPWARGNFKRMTLKTIDHLGTGYDYSSIMHYGSNYFSSNGKKTIIVKDSTAKIGQRGGLSDTDIQKLNSLYKCLDVLKPVTTPRPKAGPKICTDTNEHCKGWAKHGYCETSVYTQKRCKQSCKICAPEAECHDRKESCEFWKSEGHCQKVFVEFMTKYCPKACGKC